MKNHRYKYKDNAIKRFFYRAFLFTHINYTYDFKYKYFHFVSSFFYGCFINFFWVFRKPIIGGINYFIYPVLDFILNIFKIIKINESSLLFIYFVNFTSNTSVPFFKAVFSFILNILRLTISNINYTYISYNIFTQKLVLQVLSEHHEYKSYLISTLVYKKVSDYFNKMLVLMEGKLLNLEDLENLVISFRRNSNIGGFFLNSLERISPYSLFSNAIKKLFLFVFLVSSLFVSSFLVLFYKIVLNNAILLFTYTLDFISILNKIFMVRNFRFNKKDRKLFNVKYLLYPFSYVLSFIVKFAFSFNYKSIVDSFFRFIHFVIDHNGNLFYDRGNYWSNLKKLEKFYRFQSASPLKKDIADNFPGKNPDFLMEQGKAGPFNWDYEDIVDDEYDLFIYSDNHHFYNEAEVEEYVSYLFYKYFVFNTIFFNNLLRIPFLLLTVVVIQASMLRGILLGKYKCVVQWAGEFDNELMSRTKNAWLKSQFDTWEFWAPTNTVGWAIRAIVFVSFALSIYFVDNGLMYDGFFFPANKEVIMFRFLTWSPMLITGCWIGLLGTLFAYDRLLGNDSDMVVANYTNYFEDFEKKDEISMSDYKFFIFFNLVLSTYYMSYVLYINSSLHFHRVEEIKRIRKVFQNRNTVCDNVSLSPLSEVSGDFMAEFLYTAKLSISRTIHFLFYFY